MATKTKDLIIDSYLRLVAKPDVEAEKISITDIVQECNISRQTYYYYFKDIKEMLAWSIQNDTNKLKKEQGKYDTWQGILFLYESFLNRYCTLLKKSLNTGSFVYVSGLLCDSLFDFVKTYFVANNNRYDEKVEFALNVYTYAMIGFIVNELKNDQPDFHALITEISKQLSPEK